MKKEKIVLSTLPLEAEFINWTTPPYFDPTRVNKYMPLGILSLASNLPNGHEVVLLDPSSRGWTIDETIERIEQEEPDILGLSAVTRRVYAMNKILKETTTPYKVVGGPHAADYPFEILETGADAVFTGALADLEFAEAIETKPKGIVQCKTGINDVKFPDRKLMGNMEYYFPKEFTLFRAEGRLPMYSSVGCPNLCTFCNVQSKKLQFKTPETIIDEMEYLNGIGCKSVHILDDNFNVSNHHTRRLLDEMGRRGYHGEWSGRGQTKMDLSLVPRMVEHGFARIHSGIEALDDNILKWFKKNNETVEIIERFCEEMGEMDVGIIGYFISGSPLETDKYRATLPQKIENLGIAFPYFNVLFPEPNTGYYRQLLEDGTYPEDYWAEFMRDPIPYYEIPYPYGETRKDEVMAFTDELIETFKSKREADKDNVDCS